MSHHITINGRTYASLDEMPPEVRRQYESALQMLAKNGGNLPPNAAGSDLNISTQSDPAHHTFKTVAKMSGSRVVVNGKEYSRWEDVPAAARAALQNAGIGAELQNIAGAQSLPSQIGYQANVGNSRVSLDSSGNVTLGLGAFIVLLLLALLGGLFIGWKFLH